MNAFLNRQSGTFTETSEEWVVSADQWAQTYYQFRDGKLYRVENDNKEQQHQTGAERDNGNKNPVRDSLRRQRRI